ncbi:MAG: signal peptidase I [Clostridiales bacterium]|nr:signal peptidase I [Clostridiales bacterium]
MKNGENKFTEETFISEGMEASGETFSAEDISSEDIAAENTEAEENGKSEGKVFAFGKKLEKGTTAYEIFDWLRTICIGVLAGIFIVVFLVQRDNVSGDSMVPTLNSGDVVFAQKISTYVKNYKRGDIVILDGSDMEGYTSPEYLIKRVVGLPGETIRIKDGNVYIKPADSTDFFLLQENYLPTGTMTYVMDTGLKKGYDEVTLADNEYFCMGDNRPVSNDSRNLGPFTVNRIKGVAVIRVFPLNEIKVL